MVDRKDLGSWLSGPDTSHISKYPGERLGLPESGPGSIARAGRRILAICIDWALCLLISNFIFQGNSLATIGIFFIEQALLVGTLGFSVGHRIVNIQVVRQGPNTVKGANGFLPAGPVAGVVRALLLCLVIPAIIFDPDQRGLHDRAMNTVLLRR
ncbi:hypothetical membrane spanning protein [Renibacterium salmoninarum ATCC 33209]|uniref:Hypothetical membrane spanning protein n=1 Tax=Renibacterium salmoninarum (strain ATCC 33209 / DSM 20767 / JCM 11484 / NBRC 15589 / NCIMB 2235) TaxID=288705 RepID=A9WS43_RENSM|nr:transporter [Renibacterium salmoninarum]ABY24172.1 hypothetical membrane spanning protein [Renibacterium salmoninarum ATCC 33209]